MRYTASPYLVDFEVRRSFRERHLPDTYATANLGGFCYRLLDCGMPTGESRAGAGQCTGDCRPSRRTHRDRVCGRCDSTCAGSSHVEDRLAPYFNMLVALGLCPLTAIWAILGSRLPTENKSVRHDAVGCCGV